MFEKSPPVLLEPLAFVTLLLACQPKSNWCFHYQFLLIVLTTSQENKPQYTLLIVSYVFCVARYKNFSGVVILTHAQTGMPGDLHCIQHKVDSPLWDYFTS